MKLIVVNNWLSDSQRPEIQRVTLRPHCWILDPGSRFVIEQADLPAALWNRRRFSSALPNVTPSRSSARMGVPTADGDCLCPPAAGQMWTLSTHSERPRSGPDIPAVRGDLTFYNVAVNGGSEILPGLLVEVLPVDDPHLLEERRLAALSGAEQQDLHQALHVRFLPGQTSVDLLGPSELLHLAAVQQADGQTNF